MGDLIGRGQLSDYRMFGVDNPDMTGIRTVAGDYAKGQLADKMEQDRVLVGSAVSHYRNHAMGRLNVAFCASVKHAEIVAQSFRDGGIPAACIHGGQDDTERARLIKAFARRELLVLTSCQLLVFGFDLSSAAQMDVTVECISDLQPTQSLAMQLQKFGRALRIKDYPALIFDHAGNSGRHGFPDDEREWTLADREKKKGGNSEPTMPVKQCSECYFCHKPAPACPNCGFEYPVQSRMIDEVEGELQELERERERKQERQAQGMAKTYPELVAYFVMKGSRNAHYQAKKVMEGRSRVGT
jgi:superfamily II DNA or RNA helicase